MEDSRDISGVSRFLSGGIGGISSQLSEYDSYLNTFLASISRSTGIYPIETLKVCPSTMSFVSTSLKAMPDTNDEQHSATEEDIGGSGPACLGTWGCSCLLSGANGASTYYPN